MKVSWMIQNLYKITVEIDDDKVIRFQQHDLNTVYQSVRKAFQSCNFKEISERDHELVFVIGEGKDSFSEVEIAANALYDSWLRKYLKKMEWHDASDNSTEYILKEIKDFDTKYGK